MSRSNAYIINLAPTGLIPTKAMTAHVPISHNEIVDEAAAAIERGVQMIHLHARDRDGGHTGDPEPYGRLIESIRCVPGGREAILGVTCSGRSDPSFEARARVLELSGPMKPDMASLTLSSLNFVQSASVTGPETVRALARRMLDRGIKPEIEIFDAGMAGFAGVLVKEGLLQPPLYANVLLGSIASAQADPLQFAAVLACVPAACTTTVAGLGRAQLTANLLGLMFADGVRVGLEDSIWMDTARSVAATNVKLVDRIRRMAEELQRPLLPAPELRARLGL